MNSFLRASFIPASHDMGLLVLRVVSGFGVFWIHGLAKVRNFAQMSEHFSDPFHIGSRASLALVIFAEVVCALLLILGLGTRWAAAILAFSLSTAFYFVHHLKLTGQGNGELAFVYLGIMLTLILAGAGRFSVDGKM
jgi:putative oxidoreductase